MTPCRIFLLSPASLAGRRAELLLRDAAPFPLARVLREGGAVPLADVFTFLSGLYFRGKVAYARAFARPPAGVPGALVITTTRGLMPLDSPVGVADLREMAAGDIGLGNAPYRDALLATAGSLEHALPAGCDVVLLGSVASGKYIDLLLGVFGERLLFPAQFAGRGDMSRGGLMLRCAEAGLELACGSAATAARHGARPPRLEPRRWTI